MHCVNSVRIQSYSGPYFPAFGLNMKMLMKMLKIAENTKIFWNYVKHISIFPRVKKWRSLIGLGK